MKTKQPLTREQRKQRRSKVVGTIAVVVGMVATGLIMAYRPELAATVGIPVLVVAGLVVVWV